MPGPELELGEWAYVPTSAAAMGSGPEPAAVAAVIGKVDLGTADWKD